MDNISESLGKTLESSSLNKSIEELTNLNADVWELNIDSLLGDNLAKELPVIKLILAISRTVKSISNYLLIQKIVRFLTQLSETTLEEREKFLKSLESNNRKEILSNLILVLDKHDTLKKSEIQGRLFASYVKGSLNSSEYYSLTYATSMMDIYTLEFLVKFYTVETSNPTRNDELYYYFVFLRLISLDNSKLGTYDSGKPEYKRNRLGILFVEIGARVKIPLKFKEV